MEHASLNKKQSGAAISNRPEGKTVQPPLVKDSVRNNTHNKNKDPVTSNNLTNSFVRKKPEIQLPQNPKVPTNTRRLNPQYSYSKLAQVQRRANAGDLARINTFVVVHEVFKPLAKTTNGKNTIICKIVDESIENELRSFDLHFFTSEDTILKQISHGDILRLHRVKVEIFEGKVDGRIFFSNDVVLFKNSFPDSAPITVAKDFNVSDEDRKRVLSLQKWYLEALEQEIKDKTKLGDICKGGEYKIVCKVLEVTADEGEGTLMVTDGSEISCLSPSLPLPHHATPCIVTHITVYNQQLEKYLKLQVNDFVYFHNVKAIMTKKLTLVINERVFPMRLDVKTESVLEIKRRLKAFENEHDETEKDREFSEEVSENLPTRHQVSLDQQNVILNDEEDHSRIPRKERFSAKSITKEKDSDSNPQKNKSSVKAKIPKSGKNTEREIINDNEVVKDADNLAVKTRKTLFTPNYTDLSDATDETSENLESLTHTRTESGKGTAVIPVNTGLSEILEIMKMKYCSPRKLSPEGARPHGLNHISAGEEEKSAMEKMLPVVRLAKLTEKDLKMVGDKDENQNKTIERKGRLRKRTLDEVNRTKSVESLEEASTVVNYSLQKNSPDETKREPKRVRLESESTILGDAGPLSSAPNEDISLENKCQESRGQKVTKWLFNPDNSESRLQVNRTGELPFEVVKQLLGQESTSEDLSKCIKNRYRRMKVFLLDVQPDPLAEPLNLISGYCHSGCTNLFIFTNIHWVDINNSMVPHCPDCHDLELTRRLDLMLILQLSVMDQNGSIFSVLVCREHAVSFLKCTPRDYLKNPIIRASRCQLLTENTFKPVQRSNPVHMMDITVVKVDNTLCLVNSSLTLPPCP